MTTKSCLLEYHYLVNIPRKPSGHRLWLVIFKWQPLSTWKSFSSRVLHNSTKSSQIQNFFLRVGMLLASSSSHDDDDDKEGNERIIIIIKTLSLILSKCSHFLADFFLSTFVKIYHQKTSLFSIITQVIWRFARSDWSRTTSFAPIITWSEVVIATSQNSLRG